MKDQPMKTSDVRAEVERIVLETIKQGDCKTFLLNERGESESRDWLATTLSRRILAILARDVPEREQDKEAARWQDAIRSKLLHNLRQDKIVLGEHYRQDLDGAGCDSGDPLDLTLAEIGLAMNCYIDAVYALSVPVPEGCVRDAHGDYKPQIMGEHRYIDPDSPYLWADARIRVGLIRSAAEAATTKGGE